MLYYKATNGCGVGVFVGVSVRKRTAPPHSLMAALSGIDSRSQWHRLDSRSQWQCSAPRCCRVATELRHPIMVVVVASEPPSTGQPTMPTMYATLHRYGGRVCTLAMHEYSWWTLGRTEIFAMPHAHRALEHKVFATFAAAAQYVHQVIVRDAYRLYIVYRLYCVVAPARSRLARLWPQRPACLLALLRKG